MIHFDNISKRYPGGHEALSQINLRLEKGQMAFLTGHSGAGKSTLLKLVALIERCPPLAARIMSVACSAFFARASPARSVSASTPRATCRR